MKLKKNLETFVLEAEQKLEETTGKAMELIRHSQLLGTYVPPAWKQQRPKFRITYKGKRKAKAFVKALTLLNQRQQKERERKLAELLKS